MIAAISKMKAAALGVALIALAGLAPVTPTKRKMATIVALEQLIANPVLLRNCLRIAWNFGIKPIAKSRNGTTQGGRKFQNESRQCSRIPNKSTEMRLRAIMAVRNEAILIATGQYTLKAAAANALYLACLGAGRIDSYRYHRKSGGQMHGYLHGFNDSFDKGTQCQIGQDTGRRKRVDRRNVGIAKIQRDALIKENARKRRIENIAMHNDVVSQIWEDWRDCLLEFANSDSEDEESENQD